MIDLFDNFFNGKRVLVTGHTGFKGSWLSIWLNELGAQVIGVGLEPNSPKDNYVLSNVGERIYADVRADIRNAQSIQDIFSKHNPEIVFHLAAQPLVRYSYEYPVETYQTNLMGTINILEAIRHTESVKIGVMITTDKCYENKEQLRGYEESDPMGGYDPYSSSKGCCELAIASWRNSFFNPKEYHNHHKAVASVRAGNVIGGGDWALDRIVPDCIRAIEHGEPIELRNPNAIRPWQHVLEPLLGYMLLAKRLGEDPTRFSQAWNFGPHAESTVTVKEIADKIVERYGKGEVNVCDTMSPLHEANLLTLNINKAIRYLDWHPRMNIDQCIDLLVDWYKKYESEDVYKLCVDEINAYCKYNSES